ncbi:MAG: ISAzo13 family transposase [Candidatus Micrarchaeota archaeon]
MKWTSKSTRTIAEQLSRKGHAISGVTVGRCLHDMGYSLQANVKALEGRQHPHRDDQFRYISSRVKQFLRSGDPVVSVDTKKKELVGAFENAGRTWTRAGEPRKVLTHDFPNLGEGKAIPYGAYDVGQDEGFVNVGVSHDTAEFAVESIRRWWKWMGSKAYAKPNRILICADAGGSNGNRLRLWKVSLQAFANELGLPLTVCHYPPGTSKWNKIEHRLFSFISINWRGQPLCNYETVVKLIGSTRTRSGLKVKALLDKRTYETSRPVSKDELQAVRLKRHDFHLDWNYTVLPNQETR